MPENMNVNRCGCHRVLDTSVHTLIFFCKQHDNCCHTSPPLFTVIVKKEKNRECQKKFILDCYLSVFCFFVSASDCYNLNKPLTLRNQLQCLIIE